MAGDDAGLAAGTPVQVDNGAGNDGAPRTTEQRPTRRDLGGGGSVPVRLSPITLARDQVPCELLSAIKPRGVLGIASMVALLQCLESLRKQSPGVCRVVDPVAGVLKDRLVAAQRNRSLLRVGAARNGSIPVCTCTPDQRTSRAPEGARL
jgi:hypothetical protein